MLFYVMIYFQHKLLLVYVCFFIVDRFQHNIDNFFHQKLYGYQITLLMQSFIFSCTSVMASVFYVVEFVQEPGCFAIVSCLWTLSEREVRKIETVNSNSNCFGPQVRGEGARV